VHLWIKLRKGFVGLCQWLKGVLQNLYGLAKALELLFFLKKIRIHTIYGKQEIRGITTLQIAVGYIQVQSGPYMCCVHVCEKNTFIDIHKNWNNNGLEAFLDIWIVGDRNIVIR